MRARLERSHFHAVGTSCSAAVTARPGDERRARRALDAARAEVARCEAALSRFRPDSDLSRLNAAAGRWTAVDRRLVDALVLALRARTGTGGRFDPTVLPALVAVGYDASFEQLVERPPRTAAGWHAGTGIEVDLDAGLVRLEPGTAVDLGGIGKGLAAERALDAMQDAWPGMDGGLVDLGGDLALRGEPPERGPWRIRIADARRPGEPVGVLLVGSGGVATSGRDVRRFGPGRELHHLIDPATGAPAADGPLAVTVVAPDAAEAEAYATALAISSPAEAEALVVAHSRISALYVPHVGEVLRLGSPPLAQTRILVRVA
jgi:thiamine biosynthesis lipoprotein